MKLFRIPKLAVILCLVIIGATAEFVSAAKPDKVVALIALDTEPYIKAGKAIKRGGGVIQNTLDSCCVGKLNRTALNVNRGLGIMPKELLTKIKEMKTDENSILFLFVCSHGFYSQDQHYLFAYNEGDTLTGLKRADVIAALKKKKYYSIVFLSDSCSAETKKRVAAASVTPNSKLFDFLAKLPKGTFLDINTSRKGQISYAGSDIGGYGTWTFKKTVEEDLLRDPKLSWSDFEYYWQDRLSNFRATNSFGTVIRKQQDIDLKNHKP